MAHMPDIRFTNAFELRRIEPMNTQQNKQVMQDVFVALADGDGSRFVEAMGDAFTWVIAGVETDWPGTWRGKRAVREQLLGPLLEQFDDTYTSTAVSFTAEDDRVVVECRGHAQTKSGRPYNNHYCYVCRFDEHGKLAELIEYADTALMQKALGSPLGVSGHPSA
jgi:ketosteroid isomerase-like protein